MTAGLQSDLIAAVATAPGQGGIGIVRLSGPGAHEVARQICGKKLTPRHASFTHFCDEKEIVDQGVALLFSAGASFTGEEVVELQGHGGPVVLQRLLDLTCKLGARMARPGEFSERAFLNGKIDLAQAEAIADLIASTSVSGARAAMRSLQGAFSEKVQTCAEDLAALRVLVEACIDFPEEEVDFLRDARIAQRISVLTADLGELKQASTQGRLLNEGISVALIGAPNAGKSSLLNVLSGEDAAIVTDIPGTTRDLLKVDLVLDGLPVRLVDTAGLRESTDPVERMGVTRARQQAATADLLLLIVDLSQVDAGPGEQSVCREIENQVSSLLQGIWQDSLDNSRIIVVVNKLDLLGHTDSATAVHCDYTTCWVSAKTGAGLAGLRRGIAETLGFDQREAIFTARARHIESLDHALIALERAREVNDLGADTEVVAEELRAAHMALGEIVGTVTPDDLLGRIFSEFCIGK